MTEARDEIWLGGPAEDGAGPVGRVRSAGVDASAMRLCYLRLAFFPLGERLAPARAIAMADGEVLRLEDGWSSSGWDPSLACRQLVEVRRAMRVQALDGGDLAQSEYLCIGHESRDVTGVAARRGSLTPDVRLLPVARIRAVQRQSIETDLRADEWPSLQPFGLDRLIQECVIEALERDTQIKVLCLRALDIIGRHDLSALEVAVVDQHVTITGHMRFSGMDRRATALVEAVPGVLTVHTDIVCDDSLELDVARALIRALDGSGSAFRVRAYLGHVDLLGDVNESLSRAAERAAADVPGVIAAHYVPDQP
ncbi:MAG TPA: BON domain-containing protein [Candidatus Limnocylindrales bacterium]|nr:BON domain-containing protein [Candidatus Limnocylindrales bacterium]